MDTSYLTPQVFKLSPSYVRIAIHNGAARNLLIQGPPQTKQSSHEDRSTPASTELHNAALHLLHHRLPPHLVDLLGRQRSGAVDRVYGFLVLGSERDDGGGAEYGESEHDDHWAAVSAVVPDFDRRQYLGEYWHGVDEEEGL